MRQLLSNPWVTGGLVASALGIAGANLYPLFVGSPLGYARTAGERLENWQEPPEITTKPHRLNPPEPADRVALANTRAPGDPFSLPMRSRTQPPSVGADPRPTYPVLTAALVTDNARYALIAERVVLEGDTVAGWKVEKIESRSATVSKGPRWAKLELEEPATVPDAPANALSSRFGSHKELTPSTPNGPATPVGRVN